MKILALDSSQNLQSFAVYDTILEKFILGEAFPGKSSEIIEKLKNSFLDNQLKLQELDLLAVNLGPGSFTGIRNALCIVKTLALELKLKVFTTNSFELLRLEKDLSDNTPIAIPAFKNNFFISLDSNYDSLKTNFFSAIDTETALYEFSCENLSELIIKLLLHKNILSKNTVAEIGVCEQRREIRTDLGFDPNILKPYYLREPSIGKKEVKTPQHS
ncbi:MAG: tRNA (adenosine(37)-N6)-threonylcarbamoyltransferase complex dimerization subunit type 1 TsaB [Vampirovibrionia bacterium]|jgi:tRNA threonylcarbamoyl adenosine modification protein YeaZ